MGCLLLLGGYLIWEYRFYKTCISPFFILGLVYCCSIPFINLVGPLLGYDKITDRTIVLFFVYLNIIFICDLPYKIKMRKNISNTEVDLHVKHQKVIWYIYVVMLIGYALSLVQAIDVYGISNIKGKSAGIYGHMGLFAIAISPIIINLLVKTKKIKYFLGVISLYITAFLFGVKSYIFISIVTSCVLLFLNKSIKFFRLIKIGIALVAVALSAFLIIYAVIPICRSNISDTDYIKEVVYQSIQHLFYYYASPFVGSNTYFFKPANNGIFEGARVLFAPIVSIFEATLGDGNYPKIIMEVWAPIAEKAHRTQTNVGGLFSEAVFRVGYAGAGCFTFLIGMYTNFFYYIKNSSRFFHASAALAIALLSLCFFCNYFTLLSVIEIIVYLFLVEFILMFFEQRKIYIRDWKFK